MEPTAEANYDTVERNINVSTISIILKTKRTGAKKVAEWLKTVKEFTQMILHLHTLQHGDHEVSMEYGTNDESPLSIVMWNH